MLHFQIVKISSLNSNDSFLYFAEKSILLKYEYFNMMQGKNEIYIADINELNIMCDLLDYLHSKKTSFDDYSSEKTYTLVKLFDYLLIDFNFELIENVKLEKRDWSQILELPTIYHEKNARCIRRIQYNQNLIDNNRYVLVIRKDDVILINIFTNTTTLLIKNFKCVNYFQGYLIYSKCCGKGYKNLSLYKKELFPLIKKSVLIYEIKCECSKNNNDKSKCCIHYYSWQFLCDEYVVLVKDYSIKIIDTLEKTVKITTLVKKLDFSIVKVCVLKISKLESYIIVKGCDYAGFGYFIVDLNAGRIVKMTKIEKELELWIINNKNLQGIIKPNYLDLKDEYENLLLDKLVFTNVNRFTLSLTFRDEIIVPHSLSCYTYHNRLPKFACIMNNCFDNICLTAEISIFNILDDKTIELQRTIYLNYSKDLRNIYNRENLIKFSNDGKSLFLLTDNQLKQYSENGELQFTSNQIIDLVDYFPC
jgi:hypothetical protein